MTFTNEKKNPNSRQSRYSIVAAIVGEFMMGGSGLATWLTLQRDRADTVGMFAVLIWVSGVALTLHGLVHRFERRIAYRLDEREHLP